ncbi:phosphoribosylformylglycinamidine synthase subunit PurL [Candidatus Pelagibacter communis]|uniref:phosphoribosylformylglycinamidine synthase subunit PurL n=1 Tax=Pelagibacter ubique TaxID=198252 RepID=UPI00094C24B1|nr:phosphoribosylformylglycinamidine synthase subunit PurL [Candidatus Pelagibacter ubique]
MEVNEKIAVDHGLKPDEYKKICDLLKRVPNLTELGIFSAMWNEHCSYKSSRLHLKKLNTKGKKVIQGPGENAGVIDIGDDDAIVFKIESHNHPSFIEPYQGAATGVGGIMRDVFTMGARPIANLNSIHFGSTQHKKTKNLLRGVVKGIGGYGNCIGVPTIAGQTCFDQSYNGNILVNAMTLGLVNKNKIFYSKAAGINKPVIYVGSKTGRDGIHGASMASAIFDDKIEEKKPTVQVGDPFTEKLLLEACLELMSDKSIIAIQDMGAAGLTSSSIEMASKGNLGIELHLDKVPCREEKMSPYEIMLSESQERMLIVLENGKEDSAKKIFDKWNLDFAVIGKTTNTKNIELYFEKEKVANVPIKFLADEAPMYDRPWKKTKLPQKIKFTNNDFKKLKLNEVIKKMLSSSNICSKQWIWEQYDHTVMGDTIQKPGGDAGVVRIHGTRKAVASSVDSSAAYCYAHPLTGGKQVVCESWRNLVSVGAEPVAITNCLNFGNPEKKENMGEFVECIDGINEASKYLNFPVVSGNVSFYNETKDKGIKPTPTIGGVGLIKDYKDLMTMRFKSKENLVLVIGKTEGNLDQSIFANIILDEKKGPPPEINLFNEKNNGETILKIIQEKLALSVHDVSLGGIMIGALKMCIAGSKGIKFYKFKNLTNIYQYFFSEDQGRYIIEVEKNNLKKVESILKKNSVHFDLLGETTDKEIIINDEPTFTVDKVTEFYKGWLYKYMS